MPKRPERPEIEKVYEPDKDRMIEALRLVLVISRRQKAAKNKEGAA